MTRIMADILGYVAGGPPVCLKSHFDRCVHFVFLRRLIQRCFWGGGFLDLANKYKHDPCLALPEMPGVPPDPILKIKLLPLNPKP